MDANEYLHFDMDSQKMLLAFQNIILSESRLKENKEMNISLGPSFTSFRDATDTTGWDSNEYINLKLLIDQIKYAQSRIRDYQFEYNPQKLEENFSQTSIRNDKGSLIRLKVYRNPRKGNVDVKSENVRITQNIEARKGIIYYRLHFYYSDTHETAFILETINYQEFRNLNILLNYGDIDIYEPDYSYFLKNFTDSLRNEKDPESLKFLYENIPESILVKIPDILDNKLVLDHINILTEFDDTGIFSGWKDGSSSIVNALKCLEHIFLINEFKKNPTLCNRIYYNLDGTSDLNGQIQSNKIIFATILMEYCMYSDNRPKVDASTFKIGKKYKVGTKVTELGGEIVGLGKSDSSTFFLQQQEEYLLNEDDYEVDDLGVNTGAKRNTSKKLTKNFDEGKQYFPLEMVFFIDENQPSTIDEVTGKELKNRAIPVPAIYVKAFADTEKIENIHQTIRIVADMIGIIVGTGTLLLTGNPYLALAAAADLSLMVPDLAIQTFRQEIIKLKGGEQLLKDWDLIYNTGGAIVAAPQLLVSLYRGFFVVLPQAAQNLQKGLRTMAISVFLDLNNGLFQRKDLRLFQPTEWIIPSAGFFSKTSECDALVQNGAFFMELDAASIIGNIEKGINPDVIGAINSKRKFALVYKGEIITQGNRYDLPYQNILKDLKKISSNSKNVGEYLESLISRRRIVSVGEDVQLGLVPDKGIKISFKLIDEFGNYAGELIRAQEKADKLTYSLSIRGKIEKLNCFTRLLDEKSAKANRLPVYGSERMLMGDFNIPKIITDKYSGLGDLILSDAMTFYLTNKKFGRLDGVIGWWKKATMYEDYGGQSINLTKFWEAIAAGKSIEEAAFSTFTGTKMKAKGFDKIRYEIDNIDKDQVIINFLNK